MILKSSSPIEPFRMAAKALNVAPTASEAEVKTAYRRAAMESHPDRHTGEGRDTLYQARFDLATKAQSLLLARGSRDEAKAALEFQKAQQCVRAEEQKFGIKPEPASRPAQAPGAGFGARTAPGGSANTRSASQNGPTAQNWRRWEPPDINDLKNSSRSGDSSFHPGFWGRGESTSSTPPGSEARSNHSASAGQASSNGSARASAASDGSRTAQASSAQGTTSRANPANDDHCAAHPSSTSEATATPQGPFRATAQATPSGGTSPSAHPAPRTEASEPPTTDTATARAQRAYAEWTTPSSPHHIDLTA